MEGVPLTTSVKVLALTPNHPITAVIIPSLEDRGLARVATLEDSSGEGDEDRRRRRWREREDSELVFST